MPHRALLFVLSLCLLSACASLEPTPQPGPKGPSGPSVPPSLPELQPDVWNVFETAGESVCGNGSEYAFYAHAGSVNKLVIDFQGGGACWNGEGCASPYHDPEPELGFGLYLDRLLVDVETTSGVYDRDHPENPIKDWYHVFIPYCTGDLHIGNVTQSYTDPFSGEAYTVEHRGAVNTRAVLDWTFEQFSAPETIFVMGCSAGAYGAAYWTAEVAAQYPESTIYQLGDCGAGIVSDALSRQLAEAWNAGDTLPDLRFDARAVANAYIQTLRAHADIKMAQYNTLYDGTQIFFYAYGTGQMPIDLSVGTEWSRAMRSSLNAIEDASERFVSFTSSYDDNAVIEDGTQHCVIVHDDFYTVEQYGIRFRDWLDDYLSGREVESVKMTLLLP